MILLTLAIVTSGLFAGAAVYVSFVEHPARVSCGTELAVREFGPSYSRAAVLQASLAGVSFVAGFVTGWQHSDVAITTAALFMGLQIPYTLLVILPTNKRLLDSTLDTRGPEAAELLTRWGRLHAVRTALGTIAFLVLVLES